MIAENDKEIRYKPLKILREQHVPLHQKSGNRAYLTAEHRGGTMLNETSRKILQILTKDGRSSYSKIAQQLNLGTAVVSAAVNEMLKDGTITINAVQNLYKIGLSIQVLIGINVQLSATERVIDMLEDDRYVSGISTMYGRYNLFVFAEFPDIDKLYELVRERLPAIEGINKIEVFFISDRIKGYRQIFAPVRTACEPPDSVDQMLIDELRKDGRANFKDLAELAGVSCATVTRRVDRLIRDDIIKIVAIPNLTKLMGYSTVAYLMLDVKPSEVTAVRERLAEFAEVHSVLTMINRYNLMAIIVQSDREKLEQFIQKNITTMDGVNNLEVFIRSGQKKTTYVFLDERVL